MNRKIGEKLTALKKLVKDIDFPIIVEGVKDKEVLIKLGFRNIYTISGKSIEAIVEMICAENPSSVSILTDFDQEGRKKFKRLTKHFHSDGIKVDNWLRRKIKYLTSVQKIEELSFFIKNSYDSEKFAFM